MYDVEAAWDALSEHEARVLEVLLTNGVGPWANPGFTEARLLAQLPEPQASFRKALAALLNGPLLEGSRDNLKLSRFGMSVAVHGQKVAAEAPSAGLHPGLNASDAFPWRVDDGGAPWYFSDEFKADLSVAKKDGSIRKELLKAMGSVCRDPHGKGEWMHSPRDGQKRMYVANNYRLVWEPLSDGVQFVMFCSKEDRRYSPFGA